MNHLKPARQRAPAANPSLRFSSSGLVVGGDAPAHQVLAFMDAVLRGIGQVMLQNNSYAGLLFLAGIFYNSALLGLAVLAGAATSTATALLLGLDRAQLRAGLFGFNGALTAVALLFFFQSDLRVWVYVLCAAAITTVLMAALLRMLATWQLPALTAPFVFTTLCFVLASARFGQLHATQQLPTSGRLPQGASIEGVVGLATVAEGVFNGVAQVFFQGNVVTGILFTLGLLVSSRVAAIFALLGSLAGLLVAWGMGAAEPAMRVGAYGFNSVLTAIVLCDVVLVPNAAAAAYALLAALVTAVVYAAVAAAFEPLGMPALTLPFVLVAWVFVLASAQCTHLRRAASAGTVQPAG